MGICLLSVEEAGQLEHYKVWPKCKHHLHMKRKDAKKKLEEGLIRMVEFEGRVLSMAVLNSIQMWQPVPTAGLRGLRTWGLPRQR